MLTNNIDTQNQLQHGWEKNLQVMLIGHMRGIFMGIKRMGKSNGGNGGRIVNINSTAGIDVRIL